MIFIGIHMQISRIFDSYDIDVRYPCGHEDSTNQKWDYKTTNQKLLFMGYDKEILDLNNQKWEFSEHFFCGSKEPKQQRKSHS